MQNKKKTKRYNFILKIKKNAIEFNKTYEIKLKPLRIQTPFLIYIHTFRTYN